MTTEILKKFKVRIGAAGVISEVEPVEERTMYGIELFSHRSTSDKNKWAVSSKATGMSAADHALTEEKAWEKAENGLMEWCKSHGVMTAEGLLEQYKKWLIR